MDLNLKHPVIVNLPDIPFPMKDIYRRIGMPEEHVTRHEGVSHMLEEALKIARPLIQPVAIYRFLHRDTITEGCIRFKHTAFKIFSKQVARLLGACPIAVIFMSTIGKALEQQAHQTSELGDITLAYLLDAIASETADAVADHLHRRHIRALVKKEGYRVTPRFSPGYGDWSITVQSEILKLCEGERIDISVTEASLMIPRKSVSAVFGLKKIKA